MLPYVNIHTHRPQPGEITPAATGIHPWEADRLSGEARVAIPGLEQVTLLGEIGLDFAHGPERDVQLAAFRKQLQLACERKLPVVLHCVRAFEPLMRELTACTPRAVIFHGFIGSPEQARQALTRGYCLSFGMRTFASPRTIEALRATPSGQLFLETDDAPDPIGEVYARAAALRGETVDALRRSTFENYERIFGKQNG